VHTIVSIILTIPISIDYVWGMTITYSAPAKIILSGEHSVVYGKPAIASAFQLRVHFSVKKREAVNTKQPHFETISRIDQILQTFLTEQKVSFSATPFQYTITSTIPIGQGFGSSAALSAAVCAALVELYTTRTVQDISHEFLNQAVYACEQHFHGMPSGVDNTTSVWGGLVFVRKEFAFLQSMHRLDFTIPEEIQKRIYIVHLGDRTESTKDIVEAVQASIQQDPSNMKKAWQDFEKTTQQCILALHDNQPDLLSKAIRKNHNLLTKIGVVSDSSYKIMKQLQDFGEVKITGAGGIQNGSGYGLIFCTEGKQTKLEKFLQSRSMLYFPFQADTNGVVREDE